MWELEIDPHLPAWLRSASKSHHSIGSARNRHYTSSSVAQVSQALAEANLHPDWVAGISIGAVNSALVAGDAPEKRAEKLRGAAKSSADPGRSRSAMGILFSAYCATAVGVAFVPRLSMNSDPEHPARSPKSFGLLALVFFAHVVGTADALP